MKDVHPFPAFLGLTAPLAESQRTVYGNQDVTQALLRHAHPRGKW
jgi:hypothetical protein